MTQADVNRAVAAATGETVETVARHGFGFVETPLVERDPLVFCWDDRDARLLGEMFD
jgi:histidyl-tRNA synthetase